MTAQLSFIGRIHTPYRSLGDCPNNVDAKGLECEIALAPELEDGLSGLRVGQEVLILYWFEGVDRTRVTQTRGGDPEGERAGTFALRSPHRPNPIAAATLPIERIARGRLWVGGLDCLDGTPLLDIKPASR